MHDMQSSSKKLNGSPKNGSNGTTALPPTFERMVDPENSRTADSSWAALAEAGDILGLLDRIRSRSVLNLPPDAMEYLSQAIRRKEVDLPGLVEIAFAEVIGFSTMLLIRCQMHVEVRLAEADSNGGSPTHIPIDLDKDGWLTRIERVARFLTEICSAKARIEHVSQLNHEAKRKSQNRKRTSSTGSLDDDLRQAGAGETAPGNGRFRCPATSVQFP